MTPLAATIESILFATADVQRVKTLAQLLNTAEEEIEEALVELATSYEGRGIMIVREGSEVTLATRPEYSAVVEQIRKDELSRDLSKASAETLAVICYHPGATKAQIELIRGVNASYSLRALQMRGLIETEGAGRSVTYKPTLALLEHFGVSSIEGLPQYAETKQKIEMLLTEQADTPAE